MKYDWVENKINGLGVDYVNGNFWEESLFEEYFRRYKKVCL